MAEPFMGMIMSVGFEFAPKGWAQCNGQLFPTSQYDKLFMLLGTKFGGDGIMTFAVPDLRGRVAVGVGKNPQGSSYALGQKAGTETVQITVSTMPKHTHTVGCVQGTGNQLTPVDTVWAKGLKEDVAFYADSADGPMSTAAITPFHGSSQPHENRQPILAITYCIAVEGFIPK